MATPILREWYVMTSLSLHRFATGYVLGYPAILTPAITANSSDIQATHGEASWITASYSVTGTIGFLMMSPLMQIYGRRFMNVLLNLIVVIGYVIIALAPGVKTLIAGRSFQGIAFGGLFINSIIAAEYTHPKRRGFFIVFKTTVSCLGVIMVHGLGFTLTWRQMAWLGAVAPALGALFTINWPDSPSWLAYKGRYDESIKAFKWLRGDSPKSRQEINDLISTQKRIKSIKAPTKSFMKIVTTLRSREFLKPFTIVTVLITLSQVCGINYLLAYVIEIMVQLTGDQSKAYYYTLGFDIMKTFAILISSGIVRVVNRRTLLFYTGGLACLFLGLLCVINFLEVKGILCVNWLTPTILILYNFVCHIGIIPMTVVLTGELFPLEYKGIGLCVIGIIYSLESVGTLMLTSIMLVVFEAYGTFGVYLILAVGSLICLYYILPETKDRTLQDIENGFMDLKKRSEIERENQDIFLKPANFEPQT